MAEILEFKRPSKRYLKLTASLRTYPGRLSRTVLIREDADLAETGCALALAFGADLSHMFTFFARDTLFVPRSLGDMDGTAPMAEHTLKEMGRAFIFGYDTVGDGWEFDCNVDADPVERADSRRAILLHATGQGIWEDDLATLEFYLSGGMKPEDPVVEDDELGLYPPWNFKVSVYGDFDGEFGTEDGQSELDTHLSEYVRMIRNAEESERPMTDAELAEAFGDFDDEEDATGAETELFPGGVFFPATESFRQVADVLSTAVGIQIARPGAVQKTHERLAERYGSEEARGMIESIFFAELMGLLTNDLPFGTEHLRAELEKLK
ncbi:MAG: hypothetical protein Q4C53_00050 [Clostridia bacterium]|nr:hypothetical protein [Clostridia bacterium]